MNAFVAVTDNDWFDLLSRLAPLDEVNFWQPSPGGGFRALMVGEPFLFKLHSPQNYIVRGGFFSHWTKLPASLAWDAFGDKNGVSSLAEMRARIEHYRRTKPSAKEEYQIGCILIQAPFFFPTGEWLPVPDWHSNIVRGRGYDLTVEPGRSLWREIETRLRARHYREADERPTDSPRHGDPILVRLRLGQGTFRIKVLDAYSRRCAVTNEKVLPVLDAAHIRPFAEGGEHRVDNGLLLRSDLHTLVDQGYVTVTPNHKLEVSRRLHEEFDNGKDYFAWHGRPIREPDNRKDLPSRDFLVCHHENRFRG